MMKFLAVKSFVKSFILDGGSKYDSEDGVW